MPVPTAGMLAGKNIWVAAGEGDLARIQELVEKECTLALSPNAPDPHTYTPMHAAASYGHLRVLEYLISKGGDVNVKDEDDETPLFTVESIEVARWLVDHGATINCVNQEGNTPAQYLAEDFPSISTYLHALDPSALPLPVAARTQPSNYTTDQAASQLTQSLLADAHAIMQRAEAEGRDPDAELREVVGRVVLDGVLTGAGLAQEDGAQNGLNEQGRRPGDQAEGEDFKRQRFNDDAGR